MQFLDNIFSPKGNKYVDSQDVITKDNTTEFTPTANYQPATKKYVDDNMNVTNQGVTFTAASTRETINTGESISTVFGKLKKWFTDLKTVAFTGSYTDLTNKPTSLPASGGTADTANKLTTARTISLGTGASGSISFNGERNVTLPVNTLYSYYLAEPNEMKNSRVTPTLRPLFDSTRANRLMFLPASQIIIEKTTDGGVTWVDAGMSDTNKVGVFSETRPEIAIPLKNGVKSLDCGIRITITAMRYNVPVGTAEIDKYNYWNSSHILRTERYCELRDSYFWCMTSGDTLGITVQRATGADSTNWSTIYSNNTYGFNGWPGSNYIRYNSSTFGGGTTQVNNYWNYRFIFMTRGVNGTDTMATTYTTNYQFVSEIRAYGNTFWTKANNMMAYDHIYSWDKDQNVTFPTIVKAPTGGFEGSLNGNASTASKLLTPRTINGVSFDATQNITIEDSTKVTKKQINPPSDYIDFVVPLCSLDNTVIDLDSYFTGKLMFKRGNGLIKPLEVNVLCSKIYNSSEPYWSMDRVQSSYYARPVTFNYNSKKYFGVHAHVTGALFNNTSYIQGLASDFSIINALQVYNNNLSTILNSEIYNSLVYLTDSDNQSRHEFLKTPYVVNPESDSSTYAFKIWHEGNDGSSSGLDADKLDGHHASDFALATSVPSVVASAIVLDTASSVINIPISVSDVSQLLVYQNGVLLTNPSNYTATTTQITLVGYTADIGDIFTFMSTSATPITVSQNSNSSLLSDTTNFVGLSSVQQALDYLATLPDAGITSISVNGSVLTITNGTVSFNIPITGISVNGSTVTPTNNIANVDIPITSISLNGSTLTPSNRVISLTDIAKITGFTMTGNLILNATPTLDMQATTKQYVDNAINTAIDNAITVALAGDY